MNSVNNKVILWSEILFFPLKKKKEKMEMFPASKRGIRCLQPASTGPCSCGVSWFTEWIMVFIKVFGQKCLDLCRGQLRSFCLCFRACVVAALWWKGESCSLAGAVCCWSLMARSVSHFIRQLWWETHSACLQGNDTWQDKVYFQLTAINYNVFIE